MTLRGKAIQTDIKVKLGIYIGKSKSRQSWKGILRKGNSYMKCTLVPSSTTRKSRLFCPSIIGNITLVRSRKDIVKHDTQRKSENRKRQSTKKHSLARCPSKDN